ncbi:Ig-like domain-containing protein [Pelovirga terrestris]|uniref:Ig-like domain-containing protein n=1 Tax=Pelovirga terrestris TaxID=2771352 RepID=A0A8J6UPV3_9BACT|nr:Ig-like domain-containing protein [Pelovirga terrestris]MBD1400919.1 Ig-like domain-containing protein [Pelovirga terrestris]
MKRTLNCCYWLFSFVLLGLLTACEGGGGGGGTNSVTGTPAGTAETTASLLSGTVADGYLTGARVFLDRNGNRVYDSGEPMAISTAGGAYTLSINPGEGAKYPVVVQVIGGQTIDEDDGQPVAAGYLLEAPPGRWQFISPMTTLVHLEMQKNPTMTLQGAELKVKQKLLGVVDEFSLFDDYIALKSDPLQSNKAERTHRAAQVVASLMGTLRSDITTNLGGEISANDQRPVAYLVSDEILRRSDKIEEALNQPLDSDPTVNILNIVTAVEEQIAPQTLSRERLDLYAQAITENLEVWDMEPPRIARRNIQHGAIVSVAARVTVSFDKEIDPATISAGAVSLHRSGSSVSGVVDYDAELKELRFTPNQKLFPDTDYTVVVSGQLADHSGNKIGRDLAWQFSTLFDLTPPPLAEIGPAL